MNPQHRADALTAFCGELAAEHFEVAGFVQLLCEEQRAIQAGEVARIESLQSEKQVRIAALQQHARKRSDVLRSLGLPTGAHGLEALAGREAAPGARLMRTWQDLQSKAREARHLARMNAHLCATHLQHFQSRLGALAAAAAQPRDVYGVDGALRPSVAGRALAQA